MSNPPSVLDENTSPDSPIISSSPISTQQNHATVDAPATASPAAAAATEAPETAVNTANAATHIATTSACAANAPTTPVLASPTQQTLTASSPTPPPLDPASPSSPLASRLRAFATPPNPKSASPDRSRRTYNADRLRRAVTYFDDSPQLSERDSIFATHYVPSTDSNASTPRLRPAAVGNDSLRTASRDLEASTAVNELDNSTRYSTENAQSQFSSIPLLAASPITTEFPAGPDSYSSSHLASPQTPPGRIPVEKFSLEDSALPSVTSAMKVEPTSRWSPHIRRTSSEGTPWHNSKRIKAGGIATALAAAKAQQRNSRSSTMFGEGNLSDLQLRNRPEGQSGGSVSPTKTKKRSPQEPTKQSGWPGDHALHSVNIQSRKSSYALGIFPGQPVPHETPTKKEARERDWVRMEKESAAEESGRAEKAKKQAEKQRDSGKTDVLGSIETIPEDKVISPKKEKEDPVPTVERTPGPKRHAVPLKLLEEIRNYHAQKPQLSATSAQPKSILPKISDPEHGVLFERISPNTPSPDFHGIDKKRRDKTDQCDESENQVQISSAIYYPHQGPLDIEDEEFEPLNGPLPVLQRERSASLHRLHTVTSPERIDISLQAGKDGHIVSGNFKLAQDPSTASTPSSISPIPTISEPTADSFSPSDRESAISEASSRDELSSLTDDADDDVDATPTPTPTQSNLLQVEHKPTEPEVAPRIAVELKPFRHQVGGHSTVFKLSRLAVCKQLNKRENQFYEKLERTHPEVLKFLPRYLGVLNLIFEKPKSQRQKDIASADSVSKDGKDEATMAQTAGGETKEAPAEQRIVSKSQSGTGREVAKIFLDHNRHIIPRDLLLPDRPKSADPTSHRRLSFFGEGEESSGASSPALQSKSSRSPLRPPIGNHSPSWGTTSVNKAFTDEVLREVFSPPVIHQRRHARNHSSMPRIRAGVTPTRTKGFNGENLLQRLNKISGEQINGASAPEGTSEEDKNLAQRVALKISPTIASLRDFKSHSLGTTEAEALVPPQPTRRARRRHSGSGLHRRTSIGSDQRGDLEFFEDDGYRGDREDDIFEMEGESALSTSAPQRKTMLMPVESKVEEPMTVQPGFSQESTAVENDADDATDVPLSFDMSVQPANPKEAHGASDKPLHLYILMEDLTAGMNQVCSLDLKMGTRQYGIEASEQKRKSQRNKARNTTSQQLGVRICGLQGWSAKTKESIFEDKYRGRDISAGREFQDALMRFLYDEVNYNSVLRKIPVILQKLSSLEGMIRQLPGYRFYSSSLLIQYDACPEALDPDKKENLDSAAMNSSDPAAQKRASERLANPYKVKVKLIDFANGVAGEDEVPADAPCPPQHPHDIDRGYLRGLRSLRMYLQRIYREISDHGFVERGEGEAMALGPRGAEAQPGPQGWEEGVTEDDPGDVSM